MQTNRRSSNFELLRIIAMLMVVLSHCIYFGVVRVGQPDAYELWNAGNVLYKGATSMLVTGTFGVGLFFMISGYFLAHREKTDIKKVSVTTLFYAVLALGTSVGIKITGGGYWQRSVNL